MPTVEEGLRKFCETWNSIKDVVIPNLPAGFSRFLGKRFNCEIRGGECFVLDMGLEGARLERGKDPQAHVTICMEEEDWLKVLKGEYSIWSVMIAGRLALSLEESQLAVMLGHVLQSFGLLLR
ncbi:MAG: hypothetical protein DSO02_03565 [Hadesarchaea archaeon]|nr:MAG: hypothetical protein DSO03_02420 [Hadesarchaea archaeon]TDA33791.1 MAG: hypothetical protein DSO02_03565 [Hadesarchaea archaeon]